MSPFERYKNDESFLVQRRLEFERRKRLIRMLGMSTCEPQYARTVNDAKERFRQLFEG